METDEKLKVRIGTLEPERMEPKKVSVIDIKVEPPKDKEGKVLTDKKDKPYADKVKIICKHPDSEELIELSQVKVISADDKVKEAGLWFSLDKEDKLLKNSATSLMLKHYGASALMDLAGKDLDTTPGKKGYLCIKAY